MQRPGTKVLASSASAVEVVGLGYQVVEVPAWKVGGVGDVPLGAVPEKDDVFLVGLGGEAQDVPRYQSMAVDLVEGWRPRPDLLQESRGAVCPLPGWPATSAFISSHGFYGYRAAALSGPEAVIFECLCHDKQMGMAKREQQEQMERGYTLPGGFICVEHVTDQLLIDQLEQVGEKACELCEQTSESFTLESVVTAVAEAVAFRYATPEEEGVPYDSREGGWVGASIHETDEVLMELCEDAVDGEYLWSFIQVIQSALESNLWTPNRHADSLDSMQWAWEQFEEDVKKSSRFVFFENEFDEDFSSATRSSEFLMKLRSYLDPKYGLITTLPEGTKFFRGRLTDNPLSNEVYEKMSDAKGLGPTPARLAASNRMSPRGIPMFYASAAPETAMKEIAAHGLYNYARIGAFKNQRPLKVLDLTSVPLRPSPFDVENRSKDGLLEFFRDFGRNVTQPVIPDGREHIDYVPTQVVTEFFRWIPDQELDGIKLKSAQDGQDTFVLFFTEDDVADEGAPPKSSTYFGPDSPPTFTLDPQSVKTYEVKRRLDVSEWEFGQNR